MIGEIDKKWFPMKVKYIENNNEIETIDYEQYLKNKRSFIVLKTNATVS